MTRHRVQTVRHTPLITDKVQHGRSGGQRERGGGGRRSWFRSVRLRECQTFFLLSEPDVVGNRGPTQPSGQSSANTCCHTHVLHSSNGSFPRFFCKTDGSSIHSFLHHPPNHSIVLRMILGRDEEQEMVYFSGTLSNVYRFLHHPPNHRNALRRILGRHEGQWYSKRCLQVSTPSTESPQCSQEDPRKA